MIANRVSQTLRDGEAPGAGRVRRSIPRRLTGRKGLTLIELMLVLVILVILASTATVFYSKAQDNALINSARAQVGNLKSCVEMYKIEVRTLPPDLNGLVSAPSGATRWQGPYIEPARLPKDPWDNDYRYTLLGPTDFKIWSMGPDQTSDTADDITSKDP